MPGDQPSAWAMEQAIKILSANYAQGRADREAEIVAWLRTAAAECGAYSGNSFTIAADKIERGAGRKGQA